MSTQPALVGSFLRAELPGSVLTSRQVRSRFVERTRATTPAPIGAAADVPPKDLVYFPRLVVVVMPGLLLPFEGAQIQRFAPISEMELRTSL